MIECVFCHSEFEENIQTTTDMGNGVYTTQCTNCGCRTNRDTIDTSSYAPAVPIKRYFHECKWCKQTITRDDVGNDWVCEKCISKNTAYRLKKLGVAEKDIELNNFGKDITESDLLKFTSNFGPVVTPSVISEQKPPLHLFLQVSDFLSLVSMTFWQGGQRPGRIVMGWLKTGETKEKVLGGLMRHLASLERGERIDPVTKEDNLANFGACAVMYIVLTLRGLWK